MSCGATCTCGEHARGLGLVGPAAGVAPLRRRVGEFASFAEDLIARIERTTAADGTPLGRDWDAEGDPQARLLVELWAYVAEIVAAYTELTAGEAYLPTAADWTDLRRLAALVGYAPRPGVAAQGWARFEVERNADPVIPAGTRVQAPGTPERPVQTFEVAQDTQLYADWDGLTATHVPVAGLPDGRVIRFLGDPGFRAGDRVLFVQETTGGTCGTPPDPGTGWDTDKWIAWWAWYWCELGGAGTKAGSLALAVAIVEEREEELGTTVVTFDRDLDGVLDSATATYAAYRIVESAGEARRLSGVVSVSGTTASSVNLSSLYADSAVTDTSIVLDAALDTLSQGQAVAVVDWASSKCDVTAVAEHRPVTWNVAPGTPARASKLLFATGSPPGTLKSAAGPLTVYVVDRRVVARHHAFPATPPPATAGKLRLFPRPAIVPERVAVQTTVDDHPTWEVLACRAAAASLQEVQQADGGPRGLIVDLVDGGPAGSLMTAPASANLAPIRHGETKQAVLGSGDAAAARQRFALPDAPLAYDVDAAGSVVPTLDLRVDGLRFAERETLFDAGPAEAFTVSLQADGGAVVVFGDGTQGARLPTGNRNVQATYRVGGGTAGEVASGVIDSLLGSVRGVKKVQGAGPTTGGADQDDESRLRARVPARARAFGRAVSMADLVDLGLGYSGVTHAAAWDGEGPPGCACAGAGLHLAFLRAGTAGPRAPEPTEVLALASYLDARRDATVPLCVCPGSRAALTMTVEVAVDPRRLVADVVAAVRAALMDPAGPLDPLQRALGQPLDRSDVYAVVHRATGVVGVPLLVLPGASGDLGRRPAARHELLVLDAATAITGSPA